MIVFEAAGWPGWPNVGSRIPRRPAARLEGGALTDTTLRHPREPDHPNRSSLISPGPQACRGPKVQAASPLATAVLASCGPPLGPARRGAARRRVRAPNKKERPPRPHMKPKHYMTNEPDEALTAQCWRATPIGRRRMAGCLGAHAPWPLCQKGGAKQKNKKESLQHIRFPSGPPPGPEY